MMTQPIPQTAEEDALMYAQFKQTMNTTLDDYIGRNLTLRFLTSEKGMAMNGQMCMGFSHNGERVRVVMKEGGQTHLMKISNLQHEGHEFHQVQGGGMSDKEVISRLKRVHEHFNTGGPTADADRADQLARRAFLAKHLGTVPPPWRCLESGIPVQDMDPFVKFMASLKPCCCGDDTVDFRRFSSGLVGNNEECSICLEKLNPQHKALAFPCKHLFHPKCASKWLETHNTCPTCRSKLPCPSSDYIHQFGSYERVVTARLNEWVVSGMCEMCQATHMEVDPLMAIPSPDGGRIFLYRSQLGEM